MPKSLFFGKQLHVILDIGYSSVKIAQLTNGTLDLLDVALIPPVENEERRKYEILRAIRNFISTYKIKLQTIDLVISDPSIFVRHTNIRSAETRLDQAVLEAISAIIPYDIANAQVNYEIISETKSGNEPVREVLAVAVLKNVLKSTTEILSKLGLLARSIQGSPLAMQGLIANYDNLSEQGTLILDLGARKTTLSIIDSGELRLARSIPWSGKQLTTLIASELNVSYSNAEMLKIQFSDACFERQAKLDELDQERFIPQILAPLFAELAEEIKRTILAYQAQSSKPVIDRIILSGGGSKINNLSLYLSQNLNIPVSQLQINSSSGLESLLSKLADDRQFIDNFHYFNLVIGACFNLNNDNWNFIKNIKQAFPKKPSALNTTPDPKSATINIIRRWLKILRELKLVPVSLSKGGGTLDTKQKTIIFGMILLLGFIGYLVYLNLSFNSLTYNYNSQKAVYDQVLDQANRTRELNQKISEFKQNGNKSVLLSTNTYDLVLQISDIARPPIMITNISLVPTAKTIVITGEDQGNGAAVGRFLQNIQQLSGLHNIQLEYLKEAAPQIKSFKITGERLP